MRRKIVIITVSLPRKLNQDLSNKKMGYKTGTILSKVFIKEGSERVPVYDIEKLDDLLKYIKYQSTVRFLISFDKSYMTKSKLRNSDYKSYGVILKLKQILCETTSNINQVVSKDDDQFLDSSDAEN